MIWLFKKDEKEANSSSYLLSSCNPTTTPFSILISDEYCSTMVKLTTSPSQIPFSHHFSSPQILTAHFQPFSCFWALKFNPSKASCLLHLLMCYFNVSIFPCFTYPQQRSFSSPPGFGLVYYSDSRFPFGLSFSFPSFQFTHFPISLLSPYMILKLKTKQTDH